MGTTVVKICNTALGYAGVSEQIQAITDASTSAEQCSLYYDDVVQLVFEAAFWPELTAYATLALVEEEPNNDWGYAYRWPADCLVVRRIVTGMGRQDPDPPDFRVGSDDQGRLLFCDLDEVTIEHTANRTDPARFSAHMADAIAWRLASVLAITLSKIEGREKYCASRANVALSQAVARSLNQQQRPRELDAEHIRARA